MLIHKAVKWLHRFFGTFEKRAHTSTDSVRLLHFYCNVASLSLSLSLSPLLFASLLFYVLFCYFLFFSVLLFLVSFLFSSVFFPFVLFNTLKADFDKEDMLSILFLKEYAKARESLKFMLSNIISFK